MPLITRMNTNLFLQQIAQISTDIVSCATKLGGEVVLRQKEPMGQKAKYEKGLLNDSL